MRLLGGVVNRRADSHLLARLMGGVACRWGHFELRMLFIGSGTPCSAPATAAILIRRAKRLKTKGIYFLYRVLQALALPVVLVYFLFRSVRNCAYFTSLGQRLGFLSSIL